MQDAVGDVVELAVEVDRPLGQQRADDGEGLLESAHATVVRESECLVLAFVPTGAEPEDQPALRNGVHRGSHLGQHRRGVKAGRGNERTEFDTARRGGERGE